MTSVKIEQLLAELVKVSEERNKLLEKQVALLEKVVENTKKPDRRFLGPM